MDGNEKKCPHCAELIKAEAIKCKHCGSDVANPFKSKAAKERSTQKIAIFWIVVALAGYALITKSVTSGSLEPSAEDLSRQAIELCWKDVDDKMASLDARRAMRDVCRRMTQSHGQKFGSTRDVRTE